METKYRALRTIAVIFKVLGWVILIVGILSACGISGLMALTGTLPMVGDFGGQGGAEMGLMVIVLAIVAFIATLLTVGLYALILIAASEAIYVFLDIEENTRRMAMQLGRTGAPAGPAPPTY